MNRAHPVRSDREVAPVVISRHFTAPRPLVFKAWSSADHVKRWFSPKTYTVADAEIDCRPGGREYLQGRWTNGLVSTFDAMYHDVVADGRLVYSYEIHLDQRKISVSLATIELFSEGGGTRLVGSPQSRYFHVLAPSRCRIRTLFMIAGSKIRALTPILPSAEGRTGSQCVTHPQ